MLGYRIFQTRLANETRFVAGIAQKENYDQRMLVDRMVDMGTSVNREDVKSVLDLFQVAVERICGEGSSVCLDAFVRFAPAMGGTFDCEGAVYANDRNSIYVSASVSSIFNNRFDLVTGVEKLVSVDDLASETSNRTVRLDQCLPIEVAT